MTRRSCAAPLALLLAVAATSALRVPLATGRASPITMLAPADDTAALIKANAGTMSRLTAAGAPEITALRFALAFDDEAEAEAAFADTKAWRSGDGAAIVKSAADAIAAAQAGGGWDNTPVLAAAPHAAAVTQHITPSQIVTLSTGAGDLVFCIRAAALDDKALMSSVSVEELTEFFLYTKEVHSLVADMRSAASGRLCRVVLANDLGGLDLAGDASFRSALSASSKAATKLYPGLAGPTLLLNLPFLLQALVGLFKPLFPKAVLERLKFEKAPALAAVTDLATLGTDAGARQSFLAEIDSISSK